MLWIPLSLDLAQHPKTRRLAALLGTSLAAAVGHLSGVWCGAVRYAQDGDVTETEPELLAQWGMWDGDAALFLDALQECRVKKEGYGYLERHADGRLLLHEWEEHEGRLIAKLDSSKVRTATIRAAEKEARRLAGEEVRDRQRPRRDPTPHKTRYQQKRKAKVAAMAAAEADAPVGTALAVVEAAPAETAKQKNGGQKVATFFDLLKAAGIVDVHVTDREKAALARSTLPPEKIARVFIAIYTGEFGDDWARDRLTVARAIEAYTGYAAHQTKRAQPVQNGRTPTRQPSPVSVMQQWHPAGVER